MKIEKYISDDKVSVKDKIIGTDGDKSNKTKNFSITGISDFILGQLKNSGVVFRFSDGSNPDLNIGEDGYFFSESNIVDKTNITKFYFSKDSFFGEQLSDLFTSVGSNLGDLYLGLSQQDDSANYGFFNVANIVNINDEYFEVEASLRGQMFAKSFVDGKNYSLFFDLASSNEFDITIEAGVFKLIKNGAVYKTQDLSTYLDDTNLSRLVSGSVDDNGIATFTRDDASTFTVDFSAFLSGITPTKTSDLTNDGDGTSPYATLLQTYLRSEIDNKDATIQAQVTKLNGLTIERDTAQNRVNLKNGDGTILAWITDYNIDGMGYQIEFDADARTIYIIDSQGNVADTIPLSILVNDKLDKGGYAGTAQTLKDEIDALAGQTATTPETFIQEFYEGHISNYDYNSTCRWKFDGVQYNVTKALTFDPADADPTIDRIDMWYADNAGDIGIIKGTPSANPVEPSLTDPNTQIQIKFIIIKGASTSPEEISSITAYKENAQVAGGEYDTSENTAGSRINLASVNTPISETKSIEGTALNLNDKFVLTPGSALEVAGLSALKFKIKNKAGVYSEANPLSIRIIGKRGGRTMSEYMPPASQFGYNKDNSASIQDVSIPFPRLKVTQITAFEFINNVSSDEDFGYWIDEIGLNQGEENTTTNITQEYVDQQDAATLNAAKNHTDQQVAALDDIVVKSVNGNLPDANGEVTLTIASGAPVDDTYADIPAMIAAQNAQQEDFIYEALDASADPNIGSGKAYYFYDGTTAGTIDDYTLLTKEELEAITSQEVIDALGYTPADDTVVVKTISVNGGTQQTPDAAGNVDLTVSEGTGTTATFKEDSYTWNTGDPNTFTVDDSAKVTDVYLNGKRLEKFEEDGVTADEWQINDATTIEILVGLTDTDKISIIASSVGVASGGSGMTVETRTGSQLIKPSDVNKRIRANDTAMQTYLLPETDGFTYGQNIEIKRTGVGVVNFETASGVTLEVSATDSKEIYSQFDYVNISPEAENVWGIVGKTKASGSETEKPIALGITQVSTNSLYWPRIYKSIDFPGITTTKTYFVLYSSDHENPDGGVYWGEFDDFTGNILNGFVEKGLIVNGYQAETPEFKFIPTAKTGLADEYFIFYHTGSADPSNSTGAQETHILSLSGGELHTATLTDRGKPRTVEGNEDHLGYWRVHEKTDGSFVAIHLKEGGSPGVFGYSYSTDGINYTAQGIVDGVTGMPSGDSYIRGQIQPFMYNSTNYAFVGHIKANGDRCISIVTIDGDYIPNGFVKTIARTDVLRNIEAFIDNGVAYILWKKGTDNSDNGHDFVCEKFNLSDIL